MIDKTKDRRSQADKVGRVADDKTPQQEEPLLSVAEAARKMQESYDQAALAKLAVLDKMGEAARKAYEALNPGGMDSIANAGNTQSMNDITREEFNAKLETIEVKMDARLESVSAKIDGFLAAQSERDKRYELLAERVTKAAEGAEEAAKQAATVKSNYWAAVIVQLLAVVAILVGGYFANQANVLGAMQTTMAAMQIGKEQPPPPQPQKN